MSRSYAPLAAKTDFLGHCWTPDTWGESRTLASLPVKIESCLVQSPGGVPIDVALGALPFEHDMIERSSLFQYVDNILRFRWFDSVSLKERFQASR